MRELHPELKRLLKATSRSFYLTLQVLPGAIRPQISLAYLLARTADTIADTTLVGEEARIKSLEAFNHFIQGQTATFSLQDLGEQQTFVAERELLGQTTPQREALDEYSDADRASIRKVLQTIVSGQILDLKRFAGAGSNVSAIQSLETDQELDDYTYRVAGCVGEFWTEMWTSHLAGKKSANNPELLREGIRFGKGLQMVNILRDLPADLRQGRCYIPRKELAAVGLKPEDLLHTECMGGFKGLYDRYLSVASEHLEAGWSYTNRIPARMIRLRLACAWPVLIGIRTIAQLKGANILDSSQRVKVTRQEIQGMIVGSALRYPFSGAWEKQFSEMAVPKKRC